MLYIYIRGLNLKSVKQCSIHKVERVYIWGGGGPKGLGEGWVVVVKMPQLKIMTIVSFQKAN